MRWIDAESPIRRSADPQMIERRRLSAAGGVSQLA
jgi:hypothetical protein